MRGFGAFGACLGVVLLLVAPTTALAGNPVGYRQLVLDGQTVKWGASLLGSGAIVSYALVAGPSEFPDATNCRAVAPVAGLLRSNHIAAPVFSAELAAAFAAWSGAANIVFEPGDPATANILIGAEADPFGRAFTNVARAAAPPPLADQPAAIARSVICLNPQAAWKVGFDGNLAVYDLRYALMHEIGHAIGLDHSGVAGVVMDFRYREKFSTLQAGDKAGAVALYGARAEAPLVAEVGRAPPVAGAAEVGLGSIGN